MQAFSAKEVVGPLPSAAQGAAANPPAAASRARGSWPAAVACFWSQGLDVGRWGMISPRDPESA